MGISLTARGQLVSIGRELSGSVPYMHLQAGEWESWFCLTGWASNGGYCRRAGWFRSAFSDVSSLGA